jgi:DNA-binding response OmpR family regulator
MNTKLKKIFIADDDKDILQIMHLMLQTKSYQVKTTSNAMNIFDQVEDLPDLILLDIWMSGVDGREICSQLKKNELTKNIPVVFISANSNIKNIAEQYHADDYIAKPFEMEYFLNKINELLTRDRQTEYIN